MAPSIFFFKSVSVCVHILCLHGGILLYGQFLDNDLHCYLISKQCDCKEGKVEFWLEKGKKLNISLYGMEQVAEEQTVAAVGSCSEAWNVRNGPSWDGLGQSVEVRQTKVHRKFVLLHIWLVARKLTVLSLFI